MATKIWVKAASPTAHFYQEVLEPGVDGRPARMVIERVHAPTFLQDGHPDHMVQVPVPMQVTDTLAVRNALRETHPLSATDGQIVHARIKQCLDEEVAEYLRNPWNLQQSERDQVEAERVAAEERLSKQRASAADQRTVEELRGQVEALQAQVAELRGAGSAEPDQDPDWFALGKAAAEADQGRTVPSEAGHPNSASARQWRNGYDSVKGSAGNGGGAGDGGGA